MKLLVFYFKFVSGLVYWLVVFVSLDLVLDSDWILFFGLEFGLLYLI
jgi:hypothetical protein